MAENTRALVLFDEKNRFYYTSFLSSFGCVIVCENKKYFITDKRYVTDAAKQSVGCEVIPLGEDGLYADVKKLLEALNVKKVGYESKTLSVAEFNRLRETLAGYEFEPADDEIADAQVIKRQEAIDNIAKAEWIPQQALLTVIPKIKPGVTEKTVAAEIVYQMMLLGAECPSFDSIVCFGANSACPHHKPGDDKLEKNDIILIDIGAKYHGYCGDLTRTFCIGKPSPEFERMHRTVKAAQEFALERIKAGVSCRYVDTIVREYFAANGFKNEFTHSLGHGVGVNIHERPFMGPRSTETLQENMLVTVEPGVYIEGVGGVRIEDLVVVKEEGIENLATLANKNINF